MAESSDLSPEAQARQHIAQLERDLETARKDSEKEYQRGLHEALAAAKREKVAARLVRGVVPANADVEAVAESFMAHARKVNVDLAEDSVEHLDLAKAWAERVYGSLPTGQPAEERQPDAGPPPPRVELSGMGNPAGDGTALVAQPIPFIQYVREFKAGKRSGSLDDIEALIEKGIVLPPVGSDPEHTKRLARLG